MKAGHIKPLSVHINMAGRRRTPPPAKRRAISKAGGKEGGNPPFVSIAPVARRIYHLTCSRDSIIISTSGLFECDVELHCMPFVERPWAANY